MSPSLILLEEVPTEAGRPVWINADVLTGPGGLAKPLDPHGFLSAVSALPTSTVLSLGWTTGWSAGADNPGEEASSPAAVFVYTLPFALLTC